MIDERKGLALGLCFGVSIGIVFEQIALGIALGLVFGLLYDRKSSESQAELPAGEHEDLLHDHNNADGLKTR